MSRRSLTASSEITSFNVIIMCWKVPFYVLMLEGVGFLLILDMHYKMPHGEATIKIRRKDASSNHEFVWMCIAEMGMKPIIFFFIF